MILLTNGDSWTQGDSPSQTLNWEAEKTLDWYDIIPNFGDSTNRCDQRILYKFYDSPVWPKVLGEKLEVETWNCGRLGASNGRIFRTTINSIDYLESLGKTDLFVVIGLTSMIRWEKFKYSKKGNTFLWTNDRIWKAEKGDIVEYYPERTYNEVVKDNIQTIINMQNYLKMKKIPYLIFNAFDEVDKDFKTSTSLKYIDLNNFYNNNLGAHFKGHIKDNYNLDKNPDVYFIGSHPTDKSHIIWGEHLYEYVEKNQSYKMKRKYDNG